MVARSTPHEAYTPAERPRVTVAADGTLAAIHEPSKVTIVEIPSCVSFAELGMDPAASACEIAWVGTPPRMLVLSRYESHSIVHLVDPFGPRTISEIRLEAPMKLYAAVGSYALVMGASSASLLAASDKNLAPFQFPARAVPITAGAAGSQFIVALPGVIEEWDPQSRMPKRRLKLPRPAAITAIGGSDRVVWVTTQQEPNRIDVIPLVNRGQPKAHDLPEPIASIASHPRSDIVACIGATSGRMWVVDLDGRRGLRMVGPEGIDRAEAVGLVVGRIGGVLVAQSKHRATVVELDPSDASNASPPSERDKPASSPPPVRSSLYGDDDDVGHQEEESPTAVTLASPVAAMPSAKAATSAPTATQPPAATAPPASTSSSAAAAATTSATASTTPPATRPARAEARSEPRPALPGITAHKPAAILAARSAPPAAPPAAPPVTPSTSAASAAALTNAARDTRRGTAETIPFAVGDERRDYFTVWRERVEHPRARTQEPIQSLWPDSSTTWREELAAWARTVGISAVAVEPPPPSPVEMLTTRFELGMAIEPVIALLYAHHILGLDGAAPAEIARVVGGAWDEALGRGELAARGVATYRGSRVRLNEVVQRALDELPPRTGTLIGQPGIVSLLGPCVIVAGGPLSIIAEACLPSIGGAILAANADADPQELAYEARAYGAAPLWRVRAEHLARVPTEQPFILVADDDITADLLAVPRLT